MTNRARKWARGLAAATINGLASGVVLIVVDPLSFNLQAGFTKLATASGLLGLLGLANYLKQSPLPPDDDDQYLDPNRLPK